MFNTLTFSTSSFRSTKAALPQLQGHIKRFNQVKTPDQTVTLHVQNYFMWRFWEQQLPRLDVTFLVF